MKCHIILILKKKNCLVLICRHVFNPLDIITIQKPISAVGRLQFRKN
jgi:hypothetical protein